MTALSALDRQLGAIVIGASAGGVEALAVILPALPANLPLPVFVVIHLPRQRPSLLVEIFTQKCALAVREAHDKEPIEPGTIYFAPPDYHLLVDAGPSISLSVDELVNYSRPSIDVLFESAADIYRERLLGIVLTGGNDDGARGLSAVHRAGGLTVVQNPEEAQVSMMPAAALKRMQPDHVFSLAQIADFFRALPTARARFGGEDAKQRR